MSERNERERKKAVTFNKMAEIIENCHDLLNLHHLKYGAISNIVITYSNKLLFLEHEFRSAGINFYECESYFVIDFQLQSIVTAAAGYLNSFISALSVSKEQADEFVASYKKPSFFKKFFTGATYAPKKSFLTPKQKQNAMLCLKKYMECNEAIYNFNLKNMDMTIEFYKNFAVNNGVSEKAFNARVEKIYSELSLLGYDSI